MSLVGGSNEYLLKKTPLFRVHVPPLLLHVIFKIVVSHLYVNNSFTKKTPTSNNKWQKCLNIMKVQIQMLLVT